MPFQPNDTFTRQICEKLYETGNNAFALNCAEEGCRGHMCWDFKNKHHAYHATPGPFLHRALHELVARFVFYAGVHAAHGLCIAW